MRRLVSAALVAATVAGAVLFGGSANSATVFPIAFSASSEWRKIIPINAPVDLNSDAVIGEIQGWDPTVQYPKLVIGDWAMPEYLAQPGDPVYDVVGPKPPEFRSLRIPSGAKPMPTSDGAMTIWDPTAGYVVGLHKAVYNATDDTWSAESGDVYYLASNGLDGKLIESDEPRNTGHRGYPSAIAAVRWDEAVTFGQIRHTLKVSLDKTAECHFYPGSGNESGKEGINTCEGLILRIKPSIVLTSRGLTGAALVIATAMQRYGVVIGDTGSVPMALKLEGLETEGAPERWVDAGLSTNVFSGKISFADFYVVQAGYHRP